MVHKKLTKSVARFFLSAHNGTHKYTGLVTKVKQNHFCVPIEIFLCTAFGGFWCRGAKKTKYPHLGCGKMTAMATRGAELPWYSMLIRNHCYDSEVVGWVKPGHRFVSLVRASEQTRRGEAACGRETMCLLWFAGSTARCAARARGRGAGVGPCAACPSFGAVLRI